MATEHARAFSSLAGVKIVAVCSRTRARAEEFGASFGASVFDDVADLYCKVGADAVVVAVNEMSMREIAEAIGRRLNLPVRSIAKEEAPAFFGWLATFAGYDMPASSAQTRKKLGWEPTGPGLIADLEQLRLSDS